MRKIAFAAAGVLLSVGLLSPTQALAIDQVNTEKLLKAVTVNGILQHERAFQRIANDNDGTRASGTPGYDASADYVVKKLRKAGYKVKRQTFTFPFFRELEPAELSVTSPNSRDIVTATFTYSGSGQIMGPVVPTNDIVIQPGAEPSSTSGCEATDFPAAPSGPAIALIQRGTCTFQVKVENAAAAGYDAVIIFNEGQAGRTELLPGTLGEPQSIPAVGISFADGRTLYEETQDGTVTARVSTSTENDPDRETVNVIADSPRGKINGQTIVIGAHLDSVTAGPGINDNGSGSATILEIAEQLAALKYTNKLQRQVRFAFWGAEELGLFGSEHYVDSLSEAQLDKIYANLNFDMVGSPNYVRFVYDGNGDSDDDAPAGPPGSDTIEEIFTKYFADQGLASEPTAFDGRSDYGPFIAAGIPAGGLFSGAEGLKTAQQAAVYGGTAGVAYDECYHQACDTISNLNSKALSELGDAAAHATLTLALSETGLFPDGSRVAQVKVTGKAA
ncbi:MAG TPA: M20/M25/M40 family metallo-hydrolase, partial [Propionibacteriaceae bacterium]|nr:M20/M25/M40 family metallo-hydrolase [Propionibacteriaceae bacterium]